MGIERVLFKSEEKKSASDIANVLRSIADKVDSGSITLQQGADKISIDFPASMVLELKVEEERGRKLKKSLEIELEWIVGGEEKGGTGETMIS